MPPSDLEMPSGRFGLHRARPSQRRNVWRRDGLLKWGEHRDQSGGGYPASSRRDHRSCLLVVVAGLTRRCVESPADLLSVSGATARTTRPRGETYASSATWA